jgi:hypothetical protein
MGRYADELRKMTKAQGGGAPASTSPSEAPPARPRSRLGPILGLVALVVLVGGGWLLVRQMIADSKLQDCVMSGRKNCAPVDTGSP